ncbi:MAG TPA: hypothetical protein VG032_08905 [Acidimicrobiales bacterium]|jgi:hypothetical protein|nr:hypothetical protein [Acidimicrobiales bacterium]
MAQLDVPIVGDGESHPIARDVHRQIREAIDRSEQTLSWLGEGEDGETVAKIVNAEALLAREIAQQVVAVAYQLDNLVALVRTLITDGSG